MTVSKFKFKCLLQKSSGMHLENLISTLSPVNILKLGEGAKQDNISYPIG